MCCQLSSEVKGTLSPQSLLSQPWANYPVSGSGAPPPWRPQPARIPGIREKLQELLRGYQVGIENAAKDHPLPLRGSAEETLDFYI